MPYYHFHLNLILSDILVYIPNNCAAIFISSDFEGFSSMNIIQYNNPKEELKTARDEIINRYIQQIVGMI